VALATILIANTPTTIATIRPQGGLVDQLDVQLVNDDPTQTIDVSIFRTFHTSAEAARMSDEQFTGMAPGECRVGKVPAPGNGEQFIFSGVASGAGNAQLRYWFSQ